MSITRTLTTAALFTVCLGPLCWVTGCGGGGGGGGGGAVGAAKASVLASGATVRAVTGEAYVDPVTRAEDLDGSLLFFDEVSRGIYRVDEVGSVSVVAEGADLAAVSGDPLPYILWMDVMEGGTLDGQLICGTQSGVLLRVQLDGMVVVHATAAQIQQAAPSSSLVRAPIFYDEDRVLVQHTDGAFLLVAADGTATELVAAADVIAETGSDAPRFQAFQVVRAPSGVLYVRMGRGPLISGSGTTASIVKIEIDGTVTMSVEHIDLIAVAGFESGNTMSSLTIDPDTEILYFVACLCPTYQFGPMARLIMALHPDGTLETYVDLRDQIEAATAGSGWPFSGPGGSISDADRDYLGWNFRLIGFGLCFMGSEVIPFGMEGFLQCVHSYAPDGTVLMEVAQPALFNLVGTPIDLHEDFGAIALNDLGIVVFDANTDSFFLTIP